MTTSIWYLSILSKPEKKKPKKKFFSENFHSETSEMETKATIRKKNILKKVHRRRTNVNRTVVRWLFIIFIKRTKINIKKKTWNIIRKIYRLKHTKSFMICVTTENNTWAQKTRARGLFSWFSFVHKSSAHCYQHTYIYIRVYRYNLKNKEEPKKNPSICDLCATGKRDRICIYMRWKFDDDFFLLLLLPMNFIKERERFFGSVLII